MHDRFKFRGYWYNDYLKEWRIYDNPQFITGDGTAQIWYDTEGGAYPELPFDAKLHLCQCTGLKDKNGKLIYEGDIVEVIPEETNAKIVWSNHTARFSIDYLYDNLIADFDNFYGYELEVISNIYENPELLEV